MRKRWSQHPIEPATGLVWQNVRGTRSSQLLRTLDHTKVMHGFLVAAAAQGHSDSWDLFQSDPPQRAAHYLRYESPLRSIQTDALVALRCGARDQQFLLKWQRRAIQLSTLARRLAPYLNYCSSKRPIEDDGASPFVLVVFGDELAADEFLGVAHEEQQRNGVHAPLLFSDRLFWPSAHFSDPRGEQTPT